jgi:hypothetical protein
VVCLTVFIITVFTATCFGRITLPPRKKERFLRHIFLIQCLSSFYNYCCSTIWNNDNESKISYLLPVNERPLPLTLSFYEFARLPENGRVSQPKHVVVNIMGT